MDYIITTTDEQEAGLAYAYQQALIPPPMPPGVPTTGYVGTQAEFLQMLVSHQVLDPLVMQARAALGVAVLETVANAVKEGYIDG